MLKSDAEFFQIFRIVKKFGLDKKDLDCKRRE